MRTKRYFVNEYGKNHLVISGRYGSYCKINGCNFSEKEMQELGYEIQDLTADQATELTEKFAAWQRKISIEARAREMEQRKLSVEICLKAEPLEIGEGNHLWQHITTISKQMEEAYHGCGRGTAYIKDGKIIAFHYGFEQPENAPVAKAICVELSAHQILY